MSDDWNSDGLNDNWDEAHEFGIDLDGSPSGAGGGAADDAGFDLGFLALFDAADLLGADLLGPMVLDGAEAGLDGLGSPLEGVEARLLPFGTQFTDLLGSLGEGPLDRGSLLGLIAGLSVANPFRAAPEA